MPLNWLIFKNDLRQLILVNVYVNTRTTINKFTQNAVYDRQRARAANIEIFNVRFIDPKG